MAKGPTKKVYRDSRSGEFTKKINVKLHPNTTETETRPTGKKPPRKPKK